MRKLKSAAEDESAKAAPAVHNGRGPKIARTPVGWGVFAGQNYSERELIGEIEGTVIADAEYSSDYCMDMGDERCLEPAAPFRFMNHSCQPNCWFEWFDVREPGQAEATRRMYVLASEDIQRGDELTIDYRWPPHMAIPCRCQSPDCRGWIVAQEDLPELMDFLKEQ